MSLTGSDSNPGTLAQPFATVERAQTEIRNLNAGGGLPAGGVTVTIRGGSYLRTGALTFTDSDSGTTANPVVYRAYAGETVRFIGGQKVSGWTQLNSTNGAAVWNRIHPAAKNGSSSHIYFASLRNQSPAITSYPIYLNRRADGSDWERGPCAQAWNSLQADGCPARSLMEVYVNPPTSGYTCPAGRLCPLPTRMARYPNADADGRDAFVTGYSGRSGPAIVTPDPYVNIWTNQYWAHVEPGTGTGATYGGFLFNVLEELDQAGEYYIDRSNGTVYVWPWVTDTDPTANGGEVVVGTIDTPISFDASSHDVEMRGVVVEGAQKQCVNVDGTRNKLTYSTVRNCAWAGVAMYGSGHVVDHNAIYNTGNDGVMTMAAGSSITNNQLSEWARISLAVQAAARVSGSSVYFAHNKVFGGNYGILLYEPGLLAEYNDFSNTQRDGSDNGTFYTWGSGVSRASTVRYNYFHDIPRPRESGDPWATFAIYNDDEATGTSSYGNVIYCVGACFAQGTTDAQDYLSKGTNPYFNNLIVQADWGPTLQGGDPSVVYNNILVRSQNDGLNSSSFGVLLNSTSSLGFVNEYGSPRDLSNGSGRFSSSYFTTDPNGLSYIPWSEIGIK